MSFAITQVTGGKIQAREFENPHKGIAEGLVFAIEIAIVYNVSEKEENGEIKLDFIRLPGIQLNEEQHVNWKDLEQKTYSFPINPTPGYIDGSFYYLSHNPCDITSLTFSQVSEKTLRVDMIGHINFSYEGVDKEIGIKKYDFTLTTELNIV